MLGLSSYTGMHENTTKRHLPRVILNRYEIRRIRSGHPWIYEKSIDLLPDDLTTGDAVTVVGPKGEGIGTAIFNGTSKIKLRMLDRAIDVELDAPYFERRLVDALAYRQKVIPGRSSFRLVNSESDGLSGLIIDCYESATLFQITSAGLELRKDALITAIRKVLNPEILIERNDVSNRKFEGLEEMRVVHERAGKTDEALSNFQITIEGIRYQLNLIEGNKTGLYLDQIDNHLKLRRILDAYPHAKVLDCFSYIGGFSLAAARNTQTASVTGIDQSAECVEKACANSKLNGVDSKCKFIKANVFDWLREACETPNNLASYDVVILDPPSFTKNRHTVEGALRGYKELHVRALKLLKPGGVLLTYSCSHHISEDLLRSIVFEASLDTHHAVIEIDSQRQSLDHPIIPSIPESYYLKGFVYLKR